MKRLSIVFLLLTTLAFANSYEEYLKEQQGEFTEYKKDLEEEFTTYNNILQEELEAYKESIKNVWTDVELPDKDTWVEYSDDFSQRKIVDFEDNTITLEAVVDKDTQDIDVEKIFMKQLGNLILSDTESAYKSDSFLKNIENRFSKELSKYEKSKVDKRPILADVYLDKESDKDLVLNKKDIEKTLEISKSEVKKAKVDTKKAKEADKKVVSIKIDMPKDTTLKKAKGFKKDVIKYGKKEDVDPALIYAIMHSESSFNPMARSHIPAYGLMQIVPKSAGVDVSRKIYGKEKILSAQFLYDSSNNIMVGTSYLNILYYNYLKSIEDDLSRYYCTIAAYNTGAGNVAKAFTGKTNIKEASKIINKMSPDEVYKKLIKDLPYDETKNYLKKVTERSIKYENAIKEGF